MHHCGNKSKSNNKSKLKELEMLIEKMIKSLLVLVCVVGLAACETKPIVEEPIDTTPVVEDTQIETITEPVITAEERMRMESEEMRQTRTVYFELDMSAVAQADLAVLEMHAKFLVASGRSVTLEGHADERGTQTYNLALGEHRGNAVAQYLMNFGLSSDNINVVTLGEERPADAGHDEASWAKNRRVEIIYQ
ncbi:MAG: peptidoglycan-associated lipoprotein [Gammaproteobacteria bacterium]|nr:MAG: peptidoglycan-associated lipoprotein [Gammaproteobacteria bacterium]